MLVLTLFIFSDASSPHIEPTSFFTWPALVNLRLGLCVSPLYPSATTFTGGVFTELTASVHV